MRVRWNYSVGNLVQPSGQTDQFIDSHGEMSAGFHLCIVSFQVGRVGRRQYLTSHERHTLFPSELDGSVHYDSK